jgi:hypothetical protein
MHKGQFTPEQSAKMLRIRFPDPESCVAALHTVSHLPASASREVLIEDLFVAFEVAGFNRQIITTQGLKFYKEESTLTEETDMARTKGAVNKTTASRKRKEQVNGPFQAALKSAEALLVVRKKELEDAQSTVRRLQKEIPSLQQTIVALDQQLNPDSKRVIEIQPRKEPAAADSAEGINEVQEGMGVVLSSAEDVVVQEQAPDLDTIPGMGGQWS